MSSSDWPAPPRRFVGAQETSIQTPLKTGLDAGLVARSASSRSSACGQSETSNSLRIFAIDVDSPAASSQADREDTPAAPIAPVAARAWDGESRASARPPPTSCPPVGCSSPKASSRPTPAPPRCPGCSGCPRPLAEPKAHHVGRITRRVAQGWNRQAPVGQRSPPDRSRWISSTGNPVPTS